MGALFTALGLALAGFFYLVFAITDCSPDCVARGERAVPLALVGLGVGLVVFGFHLRGSTYRATAWGFLVAGALAAAAIAWIMVTEGSRGQATWILLGALGFAAIGAWMRFAVGRDGAAL